MGLTFNLGRISPSVFTDSSLNVGIGAAPSGSYKLEVTGTAKVSGILTLGSTISNGTYAYTLPSATGTLALTSALGDYVTLATTQTITGAKTFNDYQIFTNAITANSGIAFLNGVMPPITSSNYSGIGGNSQGVSIVTRPVSTNYTNNLYFASSSNTFTFPNATGTLALTTDLGAYLPLTGGTLTGALSGTSATFSSSVTAGSLIVNQASTAADIILKFQINGTNKWLVGLTNDVVDDNFTIYQDAGGGNRFTINTSGNVGIGTASPSEKLHIFASAGPELRMESSTVSWYIRAYNDNFNVLTPTGRQAVSFLNNGDVRNYNNTTTWQQSSDVRVKENINTISDAIGKILSLNPVIFDYKQEFADINKWDDNKKINNVGFIAQEFESIFPKYITTNECVMEEIVIDDFKSIDTGHLVAYLVKGMQEQNQLIEELNERLNKAGL